MGVDHTSRALAALALARGRESAGRLRVNAIKSAQRELAVQQLEADLRGDEPAHDFEADSLQKRLLDYFASKLGLEDSNALLQQADQGRKALLASVARAGLLGLHPGNKELLPLIAGFTDYELHLFHQVVTDDNPANALKQPEMVELVKKKLAQGRGPDLIQYLAKRLEHQRSRTGASRGRARPEVFNPALVVVGRMWTDPFCPLWMTPSAGAAKLIGRITEIPLSKEAYNSMIVANKLRRLPQQVLDRFLSARLSDAAGLSLRNEFASACEFGLEEVRRGRTRQGQSRSAIPNK